MATKKKPAKQANRSVRKAPARQAKAAPKKAASALRMSDASPAFTVDDLDRSIAWYRDVLGFAIDERWERDGRLMGVSLTAGDVTFMIGQDDWQKGRDRRKGEGFRIYCDTREDVDALAARIAAHGGTLDSGPIDEPWGYRTISLTDPDGFKITIGKEIRKR